MSISDVHFINATKGKINYLLNMKRKDYNIITENEF